MGVFGAFNYGLHLFGGYLGGRFLSNRNLFVGGMVLQVLGCACIAGGSVGPPLRGARALSDRQRAQRHVHQHDADAAVQAGRRPPRGRLPLELRRHERGLLRRLLGRRALPAHRRATRASSSSRPSATSWRSSSPPSTGRRWPTGTRRWWRRPTGASSRVASPRASPSSSVSCPSCGSCSSTRTAPRRW